ncbi:MAG TPA: glycosyltransferase [Candidatus Limnocylindrales bacterium]|nr:glycosyltransferase [Candidatus Limnocylindrales bacterium]
MLTDLLSVSAGILVGATVLLVVAGRLPIGGDVLSVGGRILDLAAIAALAMLAAIAVGQVDPFHLGRTAPSLTSPVTLAAAGTGLVALTTPRKWWVAGTVAFAAAVVATALYLAYLVSVTVALTDSIGALLLGLTLLVFQFVALGLMLASMFEVIDALCRPLEVPRRPPPPPVWPVVAFQIPAHEEPPELLVDTITALTELEYPTERLVIQVIDNNTTDEALWRPVEAECARLAGQGLRVQFLHVEDLEGYKSGALNYGVRRLPDDVELLAVIDADYIVRPDFLRATVPYFADPQVAFVQTPQEYRAWQTSAFYRACHTGFAYFFRVGMVSRSYHNAIIFAGTMGVVRRAAIEAIGGWDETNITEDAEASLRILGSGARGIYLPEAMGAGIMPLTYEGLRGQRFRWAFGGMQILREHGRDLLPWSHSGLTQRQRRDYLLGGLGWLNDALSLGFALFIGATGLGALTGHPFVVQRLTGIGLVLPLLYIVLGLVRYLWGLRVATGVSLGEAIAALRVNLSLSWVVTLALLRATVEKRGVFLRTPKFAGGLARLRSLAAVWVEALVAVAMLGLAAAIVIRAQFSPLTLTVGVLLAWSGLVFGSAVAFAVADPTRPPEWLRRKAAQQLGNGESRRSARPPAGATAVATVGAVVLLAVALAAESGRTPVPNVAPPAFALASPAPSAATPAPSSAPASTLGVASSARPLASPAATLQPPAPTLQPPAPTPPTLAPTSPPAPPSPLPS